MRFLVDEWTGPAVARWLSDQGHDVVSVFEAARGCADNEVLRRADAEDRILITNDKDFGQMVFRERRPHRGIILLRLNDERSESKVAALQKLLSAHANRLSCAFTAVTDETTRISPG